ncbi:MAG: type II secretion system F family protein [Phycisphaerae bacterium]
MPRSAYQSQQSQQWRGDTHRHGAGGRPGTHHRDDERLSLQDVHAAEHAVLAAPDVRAKVKRDQVLFFTTQLAVMIDTGVTLSEALDSIGEQLTEGTFEAIVKSLSAQVKAGVAFSAALEKYPRAFSKLFVALMRASEASGTMAMMLQRASEYLSQQRETVRRIRGAMVYPICMLSFCTLVVIGMLVFILPRFERIYAGKGAILPAPTRMLLATSHTLVEYWYIALLVLTGAIAGGYIFFRSPTGKDFMDTFRIRVPVIGRMYQKAYLARSLRTISTMVASGVTLLDGLEITAAVAGNRHFAEIWNALAEQAKEGSGLAEELANHPLIPSTVVHMVAAGEKTGQLAKVTSRVADFCEEDVKVAIKSVTRLIEPAMIILMGIIIGGIAMALLLPVFSMSKLLR